MDVKDFDYELPEELIAQTPADKRDSSRLMILDRKAGTIEHAHFYDIVNELAPKLYAADGIFCTLTLFIFNVVFIGWLKLGITGFMVSVMLFFVERLPIALRTLSLAC